MNKKFLVLILFFMIASFLAADNIFISQLDSSGLLVKQEVALYLSLLNEKGMPVKGLTEDDLKVFEAGLDRKFEEVLITSFNSGRNINQGINFLLLIDNSLSMYDTAYGKVTQVKEQQKIHFAKNAVSSLLSSIKNPKDRVGFLSFNVKLANQVSLSPRLVDTEKALASIEKPGQGEGYTEMYQALYQGINSFEGINGRKVLILLTDGENFPKQNNPHFQQRKYMKDVLELADKRSVSIFTIGLSRKINPSNLKKLAESSGGLFYNPLNPSQLKGLYNLIREQVLNEYFLTYRSSMQPAEKKLVRVVYQDGKLKNAAERSFYTASIFGMPSEKLYWFLILPLLLALLLLFFLLFFKKKHQAKGPALSVVDAKKGNIGHTVMISGDKTVINFDKKKKQPEQTVMVQKEKDGSFTLIGDTASCKLNNQKTASGKKLKSGDVIEYKGTQIVFDDGSS